jgi:hypothetical protein
MTSRPVARIAAISMHTSPLDQPGTGDSGGMNVSVRSVALGLARRGVAVDVFTRCAGRAVPQVEEIGPLTRVIQVNAGPCAPVDKDDLVGLLPRFEDGIAAWGQETGPYDMVHAHYWLSGPAGLEAAARWKVPLVVSFHTLGEVKNRALEDGSEPVARLSAERRAIAGAVLRVVHGSRRRTGLPRPDHALFETHPVVNSLLPYYVRHGRIAVRPDVERLDGDGVVFSDGTREQIDLIVYATGYRIEVPFLDPALMNGPEGRPRLWLHVFHPTLDTLCAVGMIQTDSGLFGIVAVRCRIVRFADSCCRGSGRCFGHIVFPRTGRQELTFKSGGLGG